MPTNNDVRAQLVRIQDALSDLRPKQAVGEMVEHAISLCAAIERESATPPTKSLEKECRQMTNERQKTYEGKLFTGGHPIPGSTCIVRPGDIEDGSRAIEAECATPPTEAAEPKPIDMVLFCPKCGAQHIDAPESDEAYQRHLARGGFDDQWTNPPHRSHLCHECGCIWRPADVPTNGVAAIKTQGKNDYIRRPPAAPAVSAGQLSGAVEIAAVYAAKCAEKNLHERATLIERAIAEAARSSSPVGQMTYPDDMTPELREVLGWMCFQCAPIAHAMRAAGVDIKPKAEDEQAHVLHWMVKLVLKHGADWRKAGAGDIKVWKEALAEKEKQG